MVAWLFVVIKMDEDANALGTYPCGLDGRVDILSSCCSASDGGGRLWKVLKERRCV
jgi:hypothetical protein